MDSNEFFLSHTLVNAFRNLEFQGGTSFELRNGGFSPFAWSPAHPSGNTRREVRANITTRLEKTMRNHGDADQAALDAMVGNEEKIATTWEGVMRYMKHDLRMLRIIFGEDCVGLRVIMEMYQLISSGTPCEAYTPIAYATFMWKYHVARMDIFKDVDATLLRALRTKLVNREVPPLADCTVSVQRHLESAAGIGGAEPDRKRAATDDAESNGGRQQRLNNRTGFTSNIATTWADEIASARQAVAPIPLTATLLCPDFATTDKIFGKEFSALFRNDPPCRQLFLMGACNFGGRCKFGHSPNGTPSAAVLAGVKARLQARVKEMGSNAKN